MGTDPKDYVVGPDAVIDDVDLDDEEFTCVTAPGSLSGAPSR